MHLVSLMFLQAQLEAEKAVALRTVQLDCVLGVLGAVSLGGRRYRLFDHTELLINLV